MCAVLVPLSSFVPAIYRACLLADWHIVPIADQSKGSSKTCLSMSKSTALWSRSCAALHRVLNSTRDPVPDRDRDGAAQDSESDGQRPRGTAARTPTVLTCGNACVNAPERPSSSGHSSRAWYDSRELHPVKVAHG